MGFEIQQSREELQASTTFQRNAELAGISLVECHCSTTEALPQAEGALRLNLKTNSEVRPVSGKTVVYIIRLTVHGQPADLPQDSGTSALQISGSFALTYLLKPDYEPKAEEMEAFKEGNAIFNCWPYFREFAQSMCSRMGIQVAPVPLLRIVPPAPPVAAAPAPVTPVRVRPKRSVAAKRSAKPART